MLQAVRLSVRAVPPIISNHENFSGATTPYKSTYGSK